MRVLYVDALNVIFGLAVAPGGVPSDSNISTALSCVIGHAARDNVCVVNLVPVPLYEPKPGKPPTMVVNDEQLPNALVIELWLLTAEAMPLKSHKEKSIFVKRDHQVKA